MATKITEVSVDPNAVRETIVAAGFDPETPATLFHVASLKTLQDALEDMRANHRNLNRLYMLLAAAVWSFIAPTLIIMGANRFGIPAVVALRYAIGITILPDLLLVIYSYFRKF